MLTALLHYMINVLLTKKHSSHSIYWKDIHSITQILYLNLLYLDDIYYSRILYYSSIHHQDKVLSRADLQQLQHMTGWLEPVGNKRRFRLKWSWEMISCTLYYVWVHSAILYSTVTSALFFLSFPMWWINQEHYLTQTFSTHYLVRLCQTLLWKWYNFTVTILLPTASINTW